MRVTLYPLILLLSSLLSGLATLAQATPTDLDRIVAVVEDDIIMETELLSRAATIRMRMREQNQPMPPTNVLLEQVLERMIVESIELQMAERGGIRVNDNQINETLNNVARQNNMTANQFKESVVKEGISWPGLRDQIRRELTVNQLRQRRVASRIQVSQQDVNKFLESEMAKTNLAPDYRLGHILIQTNSSTNIEEAEKQAIKVYKQASEGANFGALAAQYSSSETALSGGDLGWRKAAQLPTLFSETVLEMKQGEVATPIRNASGFHIIKVLEIRGGTEQFVKQTKPRHILIKPNEIRSENESQKLINEIYDQLQEDKTQFETLAKTYSDDPGSALQGGELGWVNPGQMVPEFEERMNTLDEGAISEPFRSQFGWHVMEVLERRSQDMSEEFRRGRARQLLQRRKFDEELDGWLREIRQNAYVEVKL